MSKPYNFEEHIYDSYAQINACLRCKKPRCTNCAARQSSARIKTEDGRVRRVACPVAAIDPITEEIVHIYPSFNKAAKALGVSTSQIIACVKGDRLLSAGYMWKKVDSNDKPKQSKK